MNAVRLKSMPDLRFPEYQGVWDEVRLGEICEHFKSGFGITSQDISDVGDFPVYGGNGLRGYALTYTHDGYYALIGRQGALCGNINRAHGKTFISEHAIAVSGGEISDTEWLAQKLDYMKLNRLSESSAQPGLSVNKLVRVKLFAPSLPEQQKIAAFLSAVDQKSQLLQRKKELLEQYKKGVMQKLFSQEIRFKDENGNDYADWEKKKIGEIAKVSAGGTPSTLKVEYWGGDIPWMNSGELNLKRVYNVQNCITPLGLRNSSTKIIPSNCILIGLAGQGKTRGTVAMNYIKLCTNQSIAAIYPNTSQFVSEFIYQVLDSKYEELRKLSTGDGGRGGLNLRIIKNIILNLPSVEEQKIISTYLSVQDENISMVGKILDASQKYKKGLLQQMFV